MRDPADAGGGRRGAPPEWLLRRLDPAIRRDAFEPAWNDALAERGDRLRSAGWPGRLLASVVLRARGWLIWLQCIGLQRMLPARDSTRRTGFMKDIGRDFAFAIRALWRRPGFTVLAAVTLALGIGANTAIFSVVRSVLLRSLPYADADRLVVLWGDNTQTGSPRDPHATATVEDYAATLKGLEAIAAVTPSWHITLVGDGSEPEQVPGYYASAGFLPMLGVRPVIGRLLTEEDDRPGAPPVALIGYGLWQRRFGGAPSVLGTELRTTAGNATIVGVVPASFRWREEGEVWLPVGANPYWSPGSRRVRVFEIVGRLAPEASMESVQSGANQLSARLATEHAANLAGIGARVVPLLEDIVGPVRPALLLLLAGAGLVLIIACANVASLLLVRGDGRRREVAVRASLGASRLRIGRELMVESLVLGGAGGVLGFGLAFAGIRLLLPFMPAALPRREEIAVDPAVLLFALGLALLTGALFGLVPLLEAFRSDAASTLREGDRGSSPGRRRARSALVVAEVAVAVVIAGGAALLLRSFANLQRVDPGFETEGVLTMDLSNGPSDPVEINAMMAALYDRLAGVPGVVAAGDVSRIPLIASNVTSSLDILDRPIPPEQQPEIDFRRASRGYFAALRIPLVSGRMLEAGDDGTAPPVALIDEVAARRFFADADPVGRQVTFGGGTPVTIVGVVGAVRSVAMAEAPRPAAYVHTLQGPPSGAELVVRTAGDPLAVLPAVRSAVREVSPRVVIARVTTLDQARAATLAGPRFNTVLFGMFAALALLLAAIGAYGVMAYSVAQRRREIGVRLSIGARPRDVARMVVADGMRLAGLGLAIGVVVSLGATRVMSALLFGVGPRDAGALGAAAALLAGAVLLACLLSARRATSVDPIEALRVE